MVENLFKKKLLEKTHVRTFADFTGKTEADIEDMFDESFYLQLVSQEFATGLTGPIKPSDLTSHAPRILVRLEAYFGAHPLSGARFNHYRPARLLAEKVSTFSIAADTLNQFEEAFKALNALL